VCIGITVAVLPGSHIPAKPRMLLGIANPDQLQAPALWN
jgi:hypothetical protein